MGWLTGYSYQKQVTLSGTTAGTQTNYQMKLIVGESITASGTDVHCENHCQDFPNDIRFTKENGTTKHDYWIEKTDGITPNRTSTIVIEVASVPVSGSVDLYMYYGKNNALSESSGTDTFDYFDDFETSAVNKFKNFEKYVNNPLTFPHYGCNGVVHPDVHYFPDGIDGYKYWMVYTPYPPEADEDPCIIRSNDGITWVDTGITNPVIDGTETWREKHQHDPDMVFVSDYSKWFMVWGGASNTNDCSIAFAHSTNGKSWTEYNGLTVNGNTNPVVLNSNDTGGVAWEESSNISKTTYPSLFYNTTESKFYLFYGAGTLGNNRRKGGFATFTWNNTTNDIENFTRYGSNPVIDLSADSIFKSGCGHFDLSYHNGIYYMYIVRELLGSANFELALLTSTDLINWTNKGKVLSRGTSGEWDDNYIYRSAPVVDGVGNIILFSNEVKLYYSGYKASTGYSEIGLADGSPGCDVSDWVVHLNTGNGSFEGSKEQAKRNLCSLKFVKDDSIGAYSIKHDWNTSDIILETDFYDDLDSTANKLVRLRDDTNSYKHGMGVVTSQSTNYYVYHNNSFVYTITSVSRTLGWHKFGILKKSDGGIEYFINEISVGTLTNQGATVDKIVFRGDHGPVVTAFTTFYVDDVRIRKYVSPEPTWNSWGSEVTYSSTNLKSVNDMLKVDIKNIDSIAIANIKSINSKSL